MPCRLDPSGGSRDQSCRPELFSPHVQLSPKLDVYRVAADFAAFAEQLPRGRAYLADPLQGAAASTPLNIAEGAREFSPNDNAPTTTGWTLHELAARFDVGRTTTVEWVRLRRETGALYRMAKRSATERAAILDMGRRLRIAGERALRRRTRTALRHSLDAHRHGETLILTVADRERAGHGHDRIIIRAEAV